MDADSLVQYLGEQPKSEKFKGEVEFPNYCIMPGDKMALIQLVGYIGKAKSQNGCDGCALYDCFGNREYEQDLNSSQKEAVKEWKEKYPKYFKPTEVSILAKYLTQMDELKKATKEYLKESEARIEEHYLRFKKETLELLKKYE